MKTMNHSNSSNSVNDYIYDRVTEEKVFANKNLNISRIKAIGFDMDYTIAPYYEEYDKLQFSLMIENLVHHFKYPAEIENIEFDPTFAVKGLFLDTQLGNILKIDEFGYVHMGLHGKHKLTDEQLIQCYKDKTIPIPQLESEKNDRFYLQSTAFATPLITLFASLIDFFEEKQALLDPISSQHQFKLQYNLFGATLNSNQLCCINLFDDINKALKMIHGCKSKFKQLTMKNPEKYVVKSEKLPLLLMNLRQAGKVTFLLTNSDFDYSNSILTYLLGEKFHQYFDYIIVDAAKPHFFTGSTSFREVIGGKLGLTNIGSLLDKNKIYACGNQLEFLKFLNIKARDILYCGDHIVGDTGATKDQQMRTLFICPELIKEIQTMNQNKDLYVKLSLLEKERNELQFKYTTDPLLKNITVKPQVLNLLQKKIDELNEHIDVRYNINFGSIFNTTWSKTWLSSYMRQKSDLYTGELINLYNYPPYFSFSASFQHSTSSELPHVEVLYNAITHNASEKKVKIVTSDILFELNSSKYKTEEQLQKNIGLEQFEIDLEMTQE